MKNPVTRLLLSGLFAGSLLLQAAPAAAQATDEVPFITSPDNVTLEMLRIAGVGARDHVIDLGSGDGRIVILAAKRFGATGLGVEIVPDLVTLSNRHARDAGVADKVEFRVQDLFTTDMSRASVITMYLLPEVNLQLRPGLLKLKPGTRLVSHDWNMGDWLPDQTTILPVPDKKVGLEKFSRVFLWTVPAPVNGLWCGTGAMAGAQLRLTQNYQFFGANLTTPMGGRSFAGTIQGPALHVAQGGRMEVDASGAQLRSTAALEGLPADASFARAGADRCPG